MKRLLILISGLFIGLQLLAQNPTAIQMGFVGPTNPGAKPEQVFGGAVGATRVQPLAIPNAENGTIITGFPYNILYFPNVFGSDLFASKGYFSDYVQLSWDVVSQEDNIRRFKIFRKPLALPDADSTLIATVSPLESGYRDDFIEFGVIYKYTVFAEGIADDIIVPFVNIIEGNGFALPEGTASGRITYDGGTAVKGVSVIAETEGELQGKSIYLNGTSASLSAPHRQGHDEMELNKGFTLQLWVRTDGFTGTKQIFNKGTDYTLTYDLSTLSFTVGDATVNLPFTNPVDSFFHITASYDPGDSLNLYASTTSDTIFSARANAGTTPAANFDNIIFGGDATANYFKGYIDEIRLYNKPLKKSEFELDINRYIKTNKANLIAYWRLQAGVGEQFYDATENLAGFNENHGVMLGASWSTTTPLRSQLAYKGLTDANGNYTIQGFPYEANGSTYRFVPIFGVHEFDPTEQLRVIGPGSSLQNGIDFTDISSFPVSGVVRYYNTTFPVEGVSILIDGQPALTQEGALITTDNNGQFTVDVPIGQHIIRMSKTSHTFVGGGRFSFNFQNPVNGLEFVDSTLVRVAGRVVGGPVEAAKPLGFGRSVNNIGNGTIVFESEKTNGRLVLITGDQVDLKQGEAFIASNASRDLNINEEYFNAVNSYSGRQLTVTSDVNSGDFIALLPPERFIINSVTAQGSPNPPGASTVLDLRNFTEQEELVEDTVRKQVGGQDILGAWNPAAYSTYTLDVFTEGDTTYTVAIDTFRYNTKRDFILRTTPTISLVQRGREDGLFGEDEFEYVDENLSSNNATVPLINNGNYTFGHPVFVQRAEYSFDIELFEQYTNQATGLSTEVPVIDGEIRITNELASNNDQVSVPLNSRGKATYTFTGGFPNRNLASDPANHFTKTLTVTAVSGENGNIQTPWQTGDPFRGIVLGGEPVGNDFVTTGPTEVITILRDPPGSESRTSLTKGQSISKSTSYGSSSTLGIGNDLKLQMGLDVVTFVGLGAGVINSTSITNDLDIGFQAEESFTSERESSRTYTTTQTWSTSSSPDFVGSEGDVFVGHATNLVYGRSLFLEPILSTDCGSPCSSQETNGFKLGIKEGLRINPEFSTSFLYTQNFIENTLIPNLENLRNSFLITGVDPNTVNPTTDPVYVSLIPEDDERFGSNNHDRTIWGDLAATTDAERANGPSYAIRIPAGVDFVSDTIFYYNQQIKEWKYWLEENERQKVQAELSENISFDGGSSFESETTTTVTETSTREFEWIINSSLASTVGTDALGVGFSNTLTLTTGGSTTQGSTSTTETTTTYSYTLDDGNAGDSYTVDIKNPADGFGPVFSVKAGVTSCPYEGQELTQYFEPGRHVLHEATVNVEEPVLSFENNLVSGVPDNRQAEFTLLLQNNSESGADALFELTLDNSTNPDGAVITIDGAPIGNGRTFNVEAGITLELTMKVAKGSEEVFNYEDIRMVLSSRCDPETFFDDATFSVFFQPSCTDINITSPTNNWVINSNANPANVLPVHIGSYDLNDENFNNIRFQYRGLGSANWITHRTFYAKQADYDAAVTAGQGASSELIDGRSAIEYDWLIEVPDRQYEIRAVSVCVLGPGSEVITPTNALLGIKDTKRPQLFGSPQPADGILSLNDEISIKFDEPIVASALTPFNFSVQGVLNGRELTNGTSIDFDGINDYTRIQNAAILNKSYTIEFWVQRDVTGTEGTVFSKGLLFSDLIEMRFNNANQIVVTIGNQTITSQTLPVNDTEWHHYAISYDDETNEISAYQDGEFVIDKASVTATYTGDGPIYLGKAAAGSGVPFDGALHEFRIWNSYRQQAEIAANRFVALKGTEVNLIGYWPFDEGRGDLSIDLARSKQAEIEGGWRIQPQGYAAVFNGTNSYLELDAASTIVIPRTKDFTIETWFKGVANQGAATLFSSGRGDGTDIASQNDPAKSLSFGFNAGGDLYVSSNGQTMTIDGAAEDFLNDDWHHIAVVLKRKGNLSVYVDGALLANTSANPFGGVMGVNMWLGARGTKTGTTTKVFDQYFEGSIDEFRVWELARTLDQINADRNRHIEGDEMGLVAYYPFEAYRNDQGVMVLDQTYDDQLINIQPNGTNLTGGTPTNVGVTTNQETANIGLPRPVSDVDFTWVVNGDEIIITPNPTQADLIENVILDITVANVEDERGNLLASPATWTAFVDRNTMKWSENDVSITKAFLQPASFEIEIINRGGTNESYTISNIPPWLTVSAPVGSVPPASTKKISFTIAPDLNIGEFTQDIRLTTDFGFDEILLLNVDVFKDPPADWVVDPTDFEYSMNVIGQISVSNIISDDPRDILAAFVGDEIRGLANLEYISSFDNYQAFVSVYSNVASGEAVEFRIWDASAGTVRGNVTPNDIVFTSNATQGRPSQPILFETSNTVVQDMDVVAGWQWLSFNLASNDLLSSNRLLENINATEGDQIKGLNGIDDYTAANGWAGNLGNLEPGIMYKLRLANGGALQYEGEIIEPESQDINIVAGWNWLGFVPGVNMSINEALASLNATGGDIIKSQLQFAIYEEDIGWIGSLKTLRPGQGYMIKATNPGTLRYPNEGLINGRRIDDDPVLAMQDWSMNPHEFADNMTIVASIASPVNIEDQSAFKVGAFINGQLRSVAESVYDPKSGKYRFFLTIGHDINNEEITFKVLDKNEILSDASETLLFQANSNRGTLESPIVLSYAPEFNKLAPAVYPNPFRQEINIVGQMYESGQLQISVFDMTGKQVRRLHDQWMDKGSWQITWDARGDQNQLLRQGIYIVRIQAGSQEFNVKVIKE